LRVIIDTLSYFIANRKGRFMRKLHISITIILVLNLAAGLLFGGCSEEETTKLKVVTSTSLIAQIVERVGGDKVDVVNIIPPAQCPGHFDVKPGDIQKLSDADLFLMHGWQGEKFSEELIASANNPDLTIAQINVKVGENDNWMTPAVQKAAVGKINDALCQIDETNSSIYQEAAEKYEKIITSVESAMEDKLAELNPASISVMCAEMQAGFVNWAGFNVIAAYGRPDSLTPQVVKDLVDKGKAGNVNLIIDNMQSGQDAGAGIAEELDCARVILSNFPGGYDNTETWEKTIKYNVELISNTLE
jgi:zinc transport system substrate-binding protein